MSDSAPRCPLCANVLKMEPTFWERIGLRSTKVRCPSCHHDCDPRDADMMGTAFWHWAEAFRADLMAALEKLPVLASESAVDRALGTPHRHDARIMPSTDELVRSCMRHQRPVLIEMARGREATLEVARFADETSEKVEAIAILGTSSPDTGGKEWAQVIARSSATHYVLYNPPSSQGAEPRIREAIRAKASSPHVGTTPLAGMAAGKSGAKRPQPA